MRQLYGYEHFKANKGVHPPLNEGYQQFLTGKKIVYDKENLNGWENFKRKHPFKYGAIVLDGYHQFRSKGVRDLIQIRMKQARNKKRYQQRLLAAAQRGCLVTLLYFHPDENMDEDTEENTDEEIKDEEMAGSSSDSGYEDFKQFVLSKYDEPLKPTDSIMNLEKEESESKKVRLEKSIVEKSIVEESIVEESIVEDDDMEEGKEKTKATDLDLEESESNSKKTKTTIDTENGASTSKKQNIVKKIQSNNSIIKAQSRFVYNALKHLLSGPQKRELNEHIRKFFKNVKHREINPHKLKTQLKGLNECVEKYLDTQISIENIKKCKSIMNSLNETMDHGENTSADIDENIINAVADAGVLSSAAQSEKEEQSNKENDQSSTDDEPDIKRHGGSVTTLEDLDNASAITKHTLSSQQREETRQKTDMETCNGPLTNIKKPKLNEDATFSNTLSKINADARTQASQQTELSNNDNTNDDDNKEKE